jgi:hypothetical protein
VGEVVSIEEANELWGATSLRVLERTSALDGFRRIVLTGLPHARDTILRTGMDYSDAHGGKESGSSAIVAFIGIQTAITAEAVMDAACVVFAHGVLDDVAHQCIRMLWLAAPDESEEYVHERKVTLKALKQESYAERLQRECEKFVDGVGQSWSLPHKAAFVFKHCRPGANWKLPPWAVPYDDKRVRELDKLRIALVHGPSLKVPDDNAEELLCYALRLGHTLLDLVHYRFPEVGRGADNIIPVGLNPPNSPQRETTGD